MNPIDLLARLSTRQKAIAGSIAVVVVGGAAGTGIALAGSGSTPAPSPVAAPVITSAPTVRPTTAPPTPKPAPKPRPARLVNPLTGVGSPAKGQVVAVKIDDVAEGRPQVGIDRADVVYVEEVESGLTRLIAVYGTHKPTVGPVRSVRASDVEVLAQYGRVMLAASGGGGDSLPTLDASSLKSTINDRGGPGFFRDESRPIPHNLMVDLAQIPPRAAAARSIGWTWSSTSAALAKARPGRSIQTVVGGTAVAFQWSAASGRYVRVIDGATQSAADGAAVSTPNVIVQYCQGYVNRNDVDVLGNPGHYTKTVGQGRVAVFRSGKRIDGAWSRPTASSGTTLHDSAGRPIALAPGGAWVVLVGVGAPLSSS